VLRDPAHEMEAVIEPSHGNIATSLKVRGQEFLWMPAGWDGASLAGIPFLAPWANRLGGDAFHANGKRYSLNPGLGNLRRDGNGLPIHGLLSFSSYWKQVVSWPEETTCRLEFWRYPDLMAQFPFAHSIEMTYGLRGGALEVRTRIENHAAEPMPLAIGFHPYFRLPGSPRDTWKVHVGAREHVELTPTLLPTGRRDAVTLPDPAPLKGTILDDVFTGLVRDANGRAEVRLEGERQSLAVVFGTKYQVAVVYAPAGRDFVCIEPMTALTNAFELAYEGRYPELQSIPAGSVWQESYWVAPSAG
jgi:aldose 1-epimerase